MKIKVMVLIGTSAAVLLCGCGKNSSGDSGNAQANAEVSSENSTEAGKITMSPGARARLAKLTAPAKVVTPPPTQADYETTILGHINAGINMKTPKGINIYNGSEQKIISPSHVPTAGDQLVVSDEDGNNVSIFASAGTDYNEFKNLKQEDVEAVFLPGVKDAFDSVEITSFSNGTYDDFPGIRMELSLKVNGEDMKQTMVMINAVNKSVTDEVAGYCYTITYTDKTGDMQETIEESISTIDISAGMLYMSYSDPEECADAQKNGTFKRWADRINSEDWLENAQPWDGVRAPIPEGN